MGNWLIRVSLVAALVVVMGLAGFAATPAQATNDDDCHRVTVYFDSDEDNTDVGGSVTVEYGDDDETRTTSFSVNINNLDDGESAQVGSFTTDDFDDLDVDLDTGDADIDGDGDFNVSVRGCGGGGGTASINDGRLNNTRLASTTIIYRNNIGGIDVYRVDPNTGNGSLVISLSGVEVLRAAFDASDPVNPRTILLAQHGDIAFYVFSDGYCQVNSFLPTGVPENFRFACFDLG
jgi:hypothetical protein